MRRAVLLALVAVAITAAAPAARWQTVATAADRDRLARLWPAWTRALAQVEAAGGSAALQGLGAVAAPDAAMMNADAADVVANPSKGPLPGPGRYRCRTIRLGHKAAPAPAGVVLTDPPSACVIEQQGTRLWFETSGTRRLGGYLYADGDRLVLLGTVALGGERTGVNYGADVERDAIGALRAVAPDLWRLELPWPAWQSTLDIVEITPVP